MALQGDKDSKPTDADGMPIPVTKKPRKNMSIYDNYRMVRPPSSTWDRKAKYEAIGRKRDASYDDVFVVSCLFHHISVLRVRVPDRLLEVLGGAPEHEESGERSWGKLMAWRSPWYDLFHVDQRIEAMKMIWAVMAYQMRGEEEKSADVSMACS